MKVKELNAEVKDAKEQREKETPRYLADKADDSKAARYAPASSFQASGQKSFELLVVHVRYEPRQNDTIFSIPSLMDCMIF